MSHNVITRPKAQTRESYYTNIVKLCYVLMMWLLCEEDYTMVKKILHHWSNKQNGIRNKRIKYTKCMIESHESLTMKTNV